MSCVPHHDTYQTHSTAVPIMNMNENPSPTPSQLARVVDLMRQLNARIDAVEKLLAGRLDALEKRLAAAEVQAKRANMRARDLEDEDFYESTGSGYVTTAADHELFAEEARERRERIERAKR